VKSLLNGHLAALRSLAKRLAKEHPATADKINKISNLERPFSPVFFTVEIDTVAALRPVRLEQQSIDGAETGMAKNGGRHFIVSELVRRKVYAPLIRVITGHAREAAATFNPAGGLSPAEACEYLRPLLEDVYADVAQASWPSLLLPSSVLPRVTILPKTKRRGAISELEVADDFDPPPIRLKEPFHNQTLAYSSLGDLIVKELLSGASGLSTWVVVFNSLMFVELLWQPSRIASAWESISKKDIWRLGNTLILRIERPSEQPVSMPLHPITTMMVNAAWQSAIPSYLDCVRMTSRWVSSLTPNTIWVSEPDSFLYQYSEIARAYHVIRLPPWLVTAGSIEMEAAAISISSIARIAYGRPGLFDAPERRVPRKSTNRGDRDLLSQVIRIVNHMGDNTKHHGEDGARKTTLTDNLRKWKANCGISIGIAVDVADWVVAECKKKKNEKSHLEVSSMSTYLSRLRPFLEKVELNEELEDLDGTQWEEGRRLVLGDSTGDSQKQASSIYRHFARFWRSRGCIAISNDILWDPQNQERIGRCHNASSTYVTTREAEAIVGVMTRSFEAGSLDEARAALYAQLNTSIAFRPAEVGLIHFQHTFPDLDALEVTTSGYSHLKHPKSSRRRISVPRSICEVLASLKKRILSAHPKSRGYFLSTAPESDHTHIADIRSAMHYALRFITGEALVKQHSLRGSAECRLVWPEFEQAIQSMQNCNPPPKMDRAPEKRWNDVGLAAVSAGHHPLSAIKYYLSMWPIFFYAANYQCNLDFRPRSGFSRFLPGIKEENIRQVLSRSAVRLKRAEVSNSDYDKLERKDVWQELLCRSHFSSDIKSIEDLMQPTSRSRTEVAPEELQPARQALKISYLALRFNGWSRELSADTFGLSAADSKWLDQAIPDVDVFSKDSSQRGISIKFAREECPEMSAAIAGCTDLDRLKLGFMATSSEKRNSASPLTHVIEAARILLSLIPPRLTLTVLPEMDQEQAQLRSALNNMDSAIEIKPQSLVKTMRYRIQIVPRDKSRQGPRPQGRYTRLFRALLRSQISILLHEKNNDQK